MKKKRSLIQMFHAGHVIDKKEVLENLKKYKNFLLVKDYVELGNRARYIFN